MLIVFSWQLTVFWGDLEQIHTWNVSGRQRDQPLFEKKITDKHGRRLMENFCSVESLFCVWNMTSRFNPVNTMFTTSLYVRTSAGLTLNVEDLDRLVDMEIYDLQAEWKKQNKKWPVDDIINVCDDDNNHRDDITCGLTKGKFRAGGLKGRL